MIHIVCVDTGTAGSEVYEKLYRCASEERKLRADRYRGQEDKLRCVTADALLKRALGTDRYETEKSKTGKPIVKGRPDFHYNLSHSGRYVVIAWGDEKVGVDIQRHDTSVNVEGIAKRYFTSGEQAYVRGNVQRFYETWTKKESYLKYTGEGLTRELRSVNTLMPDTVVRYWYWMPDEDHSLCLCAGDSEIGFELLDIRQLL